MRVDQTSLLLDLHLRLVPKHQSNLVEDAKQFTGFSQRRADFGNFWIKFAQKQQPVFAFGRFFRHNGDLVKKVFARFSTVRLALVCANCRHGTGDLILDVARLDADGNLAKHL